MLYFVNDPIYISFLYFGRRGPRLNIYQEQQIYGRGNDGGFVMSGD